MSKISQNIGRYEIIDLVGHGSMGDVYRGRDTIIDRAVAIKIIRRQVTKQQLGTTVIGDDSTIIQNDESRSTYLFQCLRERFYQEARIAGRLNHPNIAAIYDVGEKDQLNYLVFEFVCGETLKTFIAQQKVVNIFDKIKIIKRIARALHYAHQHGVIHRDIKPTNIMLLDDFQIKILDFGIALVTSAESMLADGHECVLVGTPSYMSPEQTLGHELDRTSDIFSLGVLAYEFLTGNKPFVGEDQNKLVAKIRSQAPTPPHLLCNAVCEHISLIILRTLQKDKKLRYQSANELADEIDLYLHNTEKNQSEYKSSNIQYDEMQLIHTLKSKYAFFSDFTDQELNILFSISSSKRYNKGDIIFKENMLGDRLFIIIKGIVRITKLVADTGREMTLTVLKDGNCFGEMAILDNSPRYATAIAAAECTLIIIKEAVLRNSKPTICLKLYRNLGAVLSEKLKKSDDKLIDMLGKGGDFHHN